MAGNGSNKTHGMSHTRPWVIWTDMKRRCKNSDRPGYAFYGAKGITFDPRWERFENFWADMEAGYKPDLTLDRIDPSGNYNKNNCCWVPRKMQARNKKTYSTNNTGVAGTYLTQNKGVPTLKAHISDNGKRYTKNFSLNKYTMQEALRLAGEWREEMKQELNYSVFHGNKNEG